MDKKPAPRVRAAQNAGSFLSWLMRSTLVLYVVLEAIETIRSIRNWMKDREAS